MGAVARVAASSRALLRRNRSTFASSLAGASQSSLRLDAACAATFSTPEGSSDLDADVGCNPGFQSWITNPVLARELPARQLHTQRILLSRALASLAPHSPALGDTKGSRRSSSSRSSPSPSSDVLSPSIAVGSEEGGPRSAATQQQQNSSYQQPPGTPHLKGGGGEKRSAGTEETEAGAGADPAKAVLSASLPIVLECGWTEAAMLEGARAAGLSPAILSLFPRREAHLVEYFMDECRRKFEEDAGRRAGELLVLDDLGQRLQLVVRMRLEQQALYTSTWAQALAVQALPTNLPHTAQQRLQLVASLWAAAGERTRSDLEARTLCAMLSAVYTASELYMLTDFSAGYEETWKFVQRRTSEGLQALNGLTAAQEQLQQAALGLFKSLGISAPPASGPWNIPFPPLQNTLFGSKGGHHGASSGGSKGASGGSWHDDAGAGGAPGQGVHPESVTSTTEYCPASAAGDAPLSENSGPQSQKKE